MPPKNAEAPVFSADGREISLSRILNAPPELVWRVWTDPAHIGVWWGPRGFHTTTSQMDVRPGGTWTFVMHGPDGVDYQNRIVYQEVIPGKKLTYAHAGAEETADVRFSVRVDFEEEDGKTRVSMRMTFATAEECRHVVEKYGALEGAVQNLDRLGDYVFQQNPGAFVLTREFDAPRSLVFSAWTEADRLAQWFAPRGFRTEVLKLDLQPGGIFHYHMSGPENMDLYGKWIFRDLVTPSRIAFVQSFSNAEAGEGRHPKLPVWPKETLSSVTFEEAAGNRTKLILRSTPINATEEERAVFLSLFESMTAGWGGTLDYLAAYLAKN